MTSQARRGKWLYLTLAAIIVLERLVAVGAALASGGEGFRWMSSVAQPVGFAIAAAGMWYGTVLLRWIVGATCLLVGGDLVVKCARAWVALAEATPPALTGVLLPAVGYSLAFVAAIGTFYVVAGLLFLCSPSLRAFFQHQLVQAGRPDFFNKVDAWNEDWGGGKPIASDRSLGTLKLRSGTLLLGDPQYLPGLEVPNIAASEIAISARVLRYPSGAETMSSLTLRYEPDASARESLADASGS